MKCSLKNTLESVLIPFKNEVTTQISFLSQLMWGKWKAPENCLVENYVLGIRVDSVKNELV